jgi:hypothetical protein
MTLCGRNLHEKLIVVPLVKKFASSYGTRRFITIFLSACHWSLSVAKRIQYTSSHLRKRSSNLLLAFTISLLVSGPVGTHDHIFVLSKTTYVFWNAVSATTRRDPISEHIRCLGKNKNIIPPNLLKIHLILTFYLRLGHPSVFFPSNIHMDFSSLPCLLHARSVLFFLIWSQ